MYRDSHPNVMINVLGRGTMYDNWDLVTISLVRQVLHFSLACSQHSCMCASSIILYAGPLHCLYLLL